MSNVVQQTAIGAVPVDWEIVKLGDIISDLKSGVSVNSEDKRIDAPGEIGILKTSAVANGLFLPHQHKLVIEKDVQRAKLNPVKGSILVSRMNTPALVGDSCYVDKDYPSLFIPDRLWMTVFNTMKIVSSRWLSFVLVSDSFKEIIKSTATGTSNSMKNISKGSFLSLEILLPPFAEQQKIAEILSTVDEKMAVIDEQLAQTQVLKRGLMQHLLTRGIGHSTFKDSPLGEIPESWEVMSIDDLLTVFQNGYAFSSDGYAESGVPIVSMSNIGLDGSFNFSFDKCKFWPIDTLQRLKNFEVVKGDLLIAMTDVTPSKNLIGAIARVDIDAYFLLNQRVGLLRVNENIINKDYLKQFGSSDYWRRHCKSIASLGVQANLSTSGIKKSLICVPPIFEQNQIAEILNTIDDKLQILVDKKAQYQELKRGLMQQLLTGQRRVKVPELAMA